MKGRVALVGILCIAMLVVTGAYADKPEKPAKPNKPFSTTECIEFGGESADLVGKQIVEGCCPNRGPFPLYTMTLPGGFWDYYAGTYEGQLYVNNIHPGRIQDYGYMVQFWTPADPVPEVAFTVTGGDVEIFDRKNNKVRVSFTPDNSKCDDRGAPRESCLTFTLTMTSDLTACQ